MRRVFTAKDPLMIGHLRNVLATFGIECVTKNVHLATAAGELPVIECWPELWVIDERRFDEAQTILKRTLAPLESVKKPWQCHGCGEQVEGQFSECWNCGQSRSQGAEPRGVARVPRARFNRSR